MGNIFPEPNQKPPNVDNPESTGAYTEGFITTRRLYFLTWQADDLDLAMDLWGDPEVTRFIVAKGQLSEDEVKARLFQEIDSQKIHGIQYWPCFLKSNSNPVGCCGIRPYQPSKRIYEIGFHILRRCWGKGFAMEAARGVMAYAFKELSVAGLFAGHHPDNTASPHVLERLGFEYTHHAYYEPTGLQHPSYILNREAYFHVKNKKISPQSHKGN